MSTVQPTEAEIARRDARRGLVRRAIIVVVLALVVLGVVHMMQKRQEHGSAHVATKLVTIVKSTSRADGVHVTALLDAPSPNGTSHQIEGVVPREAWKLSRTVWACYPPGDPDKGVLRTPLDPDCVNLVAGS